MFQNCLIPFNVQLQAASEYENFHYMHICMYQSQKMPILHMLTLSEINTGTINANINIILCYLVNSHNDHACQIYYILVRTYFG
jgi:predicted ferric reductase